LPVLTAFENVELPLLLAPLSKAERKKHVETALTLVGLADRMRHYPRQLSGGQEQRVAIARAIASDPTILVADEPTGDLDRKSAEEVRTLLERLNKEFKKTIVMATHDPHAAERAHLVRHLHKGELQSGRGRETAATRFQEPVPASPPHGAHRRGDRDGGDGVRPDSDDRGRVERRRRRVSGEPDDHAAQRVVHLPGPAAVPPANRPGPGR